MSEPLPFEVACPVRMHAEQSAGKEPIRKVDGNVEVTSQACCIGEDCAWFIKGKGCTVASE